LHWQYTNQRRIKRQSSRHDNKVFLQREERRKEEKRKRRKDGWMDGSGYF